MAYHFPLPPPVNDHASPPSPPRTSVTERDAGDPACGQDDQDDSCGLGTNQGIDSVPVHRSTDQPEPSLEGRQRPRVASIEVLVYDSDHSDHSSHNKPGVLSTKTARLPFFGRRKSDVGLNHHHQAGGGGCSMVAALKPRASVSSLITMRSDGSLARFDGERGKATSGSSRSSGLIRGSEQVEHVSFLVWLGWVRFMYASNEFQAQTFCCLSQKNSFTLVYSLYAASVEYENGNPRRLCDGFDFFTSVLDVNKTFAFIKNKKKQNRSKCN